MDRNDTLNHYLDEVIARHMYTTEGNLRFHMETLFEGLDLTLLSGESVVSDKYSPCGGQDRPPMG